MGEKARLKVIGHKAHGLDKLGELKEQGGRYRVREDLGLERAKVSSSAEASGGGWAGGGPHN